MNNYIYKFIKYVLLVSCLFNAASASEELLVWEKQVTNDQINSFALSPDGKNIAAISKDNSITLIDNRGDKIWSLKVEEIQLTDISMNQKFIVVGGYRKNSLQNDIGHVLLYKLSGNLVFDKELKETVDYLGRTEKKVESTPIFNVDISKDSTIILATGGQNKFVLNLEGKIISKSDFEEKIISSKITSDRENILLVFDKTIKLFNNQDVYYNGFKLDDTIRDISISDSGYNALITQNKVFLYKNDIKLWEKNTTDFNIFKSISISSDGNWIVLSSVKNSISILDRTGDEIIKYQLDKSYFSKVIISSDGRSVVALPILTSQLSFFDLSSFILGSISINSIQGAEIYINGDFKGKTPLDISNINPGTHFVEISKKGYETWSGNVTVEPGKNEELSLMLSAVQPTPYPTTEQKSNSTIVIPSETLSSTDSTPVPNGKNTFSIISFAAGSFMILVFVGAVAISKGRKKKDISKAISTEDKHSSSKIVPTFSAPDIKRGYVVLPNNDIKFGIRLTNNMDYTITDIDVILDFTEELFEVKKSRIQSIGNIPPKTSRTLTYILKPLGCIHHEDVNSIVTYKDATGTKHAIHMNTKEVHCVCPFLKEKPMSEADYRRLVGNSEIIQEGISFKGISVDELASFIGETCRHMLYKVREYDIDDKKIIYLAGESLGEKAYYLMTVVVQEYMGLTQIVLGAHSDKKYGLNGFMNEMADSIRHLVDSVQGAKEIGIIENNQVINIIDSVVQRTSFEIGHGGNTEVNIKDSVVQSSNIEKNS